MIDRRVVVIAPSSLSGPRHLLEAGAERVLIVGEKPTDDADGESNPDAKLEIRPGGPALPLRDECVDVVLCPNDFSAWDASERGKLLQEARRVLRKDGLFIAQIEAHAESRLDFWDFEEELAFHFAKVEFFSRTPWSGLSFAPIFDEDDPRARGGIALELNETLLRALPDATHYLALAGRSPEALLLDARCLLVPLPEGTAEQGLRAEEREELEGLREELEGLRVELGTRAARLVAAQSNLRDLEQQLEALHQREGSRSEGELDALRSDLEEARSRIELLRLREQELAEKLAQYEREREELTREQAEQLSLYESERESLLREVETLRQGANDLAILTRTVAEQEKALTRWASQSAEERSHTEALRQRESSLKERVDSLDGEREELRRQVDVLLAEREGARKLASRVEAELEVALRRNEEREREFAEKLERSSRMEGELEGLRTRNGELERLLNQSRTRAEELSVSAAQGVEQGRMLADIALDRDRLREELSERARRIEELESKLWNSREELQRERIENVRGAAKLERQREMLERGRQAEEELEGRIEALGRELRESELQRAESAAVVKSRDERLAQLRSESEAMADRSSEVESLRAELEARGQELADIKGGLEQARLREERNLQQLRRRERELEDAGENLRSLQNSVDQQAKLASELQGEIDVRELELERMGGTIEDLRSELDWERAQREQLEKKKLVLQRDMEEALLARDGFQRRLRAKEQELEDIVGAHELHSIELFKLRRELDAAAEVNERLEGALPQGAEGEEEARENWPEDAKQELQRLREQLELQARRYAQENANRGERAESERVRRLQLEVKMRAAEQEHMLAELDAAEQRIWEMNDATDRNAARLAASLAQLEKHKEKVDELSDELDVTRSLLAAEQTRGLERERLLASERAKLARAGVERESGPSESFVEKGDEGEAFTDLAVEGGAPLVELDFERRKEETDGAEAANDSETLPPSPEEEALRIESVSSASSALRSPTSIASFGALAEHPQEGRKELAENPHEKTRVTVEAVDEEEWEEPAGGVSEGGFFPKGTAANEDKERDEGAVELSVDISS